MLVVMEGMTYARVMSVNYYYSLDNADIGVEGRFDASLVGRALDVVTQQYAQVFSSELERVEERSKRDCDGKVLEYVFDDANERDMVMVGLRSVISEARTTPGIRASIRERRGLQLAGRILTVGY